MSSAQATIPRDEGAGATARGHLYTSLTRDEEDTILGYGPEWHAAAAAFHKYGRGRHRASLNFGDRLAYAAAAVAGDALLFVGDDFAHTDITAA